MYNPTRYEHVYGIQLVDDLHNLFPEVLYDDRLFSSNVLIPFVQKRVSDLFPAEYVQKGAHYRLFQQERRRAEAFHVAASSVPPPPPPVAPLRRVVQRAAVAATTGLGGGFGNLFDFGLGGSLLSSLEHLATEALSPVPVVPSAEQIREATLVTSIEPARDVVCAVCQDHAPPQDASSDWRIIRHCNHRFHKDCIDRWFEQKTFCPVCRFDIRDGGEAADVDSS